MSSSTLGFMPRPVCELCGSPSPTSLLKRPFNDSTIADFLGQYYAGRIPQSLLTDSMYEVVKCSQCGFIWQAHILNDAGMAALYEHWISAEDSLKKKQKFSLAGYQRQTALIQPLFPEKTPAAIHVLDFGMGWGHWCLAAAAQGYQVVGLEVSPSRVQYAREQGVTVIENLDDLAGKHFDFINAEQVFEHIPQPLETLKTLVAYLHPGGVVRIAVPDGAGIERELAQADWRPSKNAVHPLEHINTFTHQTLRKLGKNAGLRVIPQPLQRADWRSWGRSMAVSLYRQFFGTALYFQKPG